LLSENMILRICPKALAGHYLRSEWKSGLRNRWLMTP
jgi:hypothetical protein